NWSYVSPALSQTPTFAPASGESSAFLTTPAKVRAGFNFTSRFVVSSGNSSVAARLRTVSRTTSSALPDCICQGWSDHVRLKAPLVVAFVQREPLDGNTATCAPTAG